MYVKMHYRYPTETSIYVTSSDLPYISSSDLNGLSGVIIMTLFTPRF